MPSPHQDHDQKRAHEEIRGHHEDGARVVNPAHIHDGQRNQHAEADLERVRLQAAAQPRSSAPTPAEMPTDAVRM